MTTFTANLVLVGTTLNDGTGDPLRTAFTRINENFTSLSTLTKTITMVVGDETTNITTGAGKYTMRMPQALTLTEVRASLTVAQTAGSAVIVDVNKMGTSILSGKLTFTNAGNTTVGSGTPTVISDTVLPDNTVISVDIDQVGTPLAKGLKVYLIGY